MNFQTTYFLQNSVEYGAKHKNTAQSSILPGTIFVSLPVESHGPVRLPIYFFLLVVLQSGF